MQAGRQDNIITVLVVDDDPSMIRVLRMLLSTKGFHILEAESGVKGMMIAKREQPDVVLLDIMMPDVDGFEVCRKLKLQPETKEIPVIFVTAKTASEHVERGISLGAQGYVTKPFHPKELVSKIMEITETA